MTHSPHLAELHSSWQRWTLAALITATLVFGFWGNWNYEQAHFPAHAPDVVSVFYHSCQFLIAHGVHLEGDIPWQLHAGRLLGIVALFTAGILAFAKFFRSEMLMLKLRAPWQRDHVIICGLGDLGLRLALDARRRGKFVVAIEKHGEEAAIERARNGGVLVIEGDACDRSTMRKVRVDSAEFLVAACQDDATNVAIAAIVAQSLPSGLKRSRPLVCRLLLRDHELRRQLEQKSVFQGVVNSVAGIGGSYTVNFRDLNLHEIASRQSLRRYPLDFQQIRKDTTVQLVIVGFGEMGQHLALHSARVGHFANRAIQDRKLRITVVDSDVGARVATFRGRYPKLDLLCELRHHEVDSRAADFFEVIDKLSAEAQQRQEQVTYAICFETGPSASDRENLRIGLELSGRVNKRPVQILLYQSTRCGFAALFPAEAGGAAMGCPLNAFGMIEDIYSLDVLLHESEDRVARAIHEDYVAHRRRAGQTEADWESLSDGLKDSNRHAADHIPIKLRALGYHDAPLQPGRPRIDVFTEEEVALLAQLEHLRWSAERWLAGWEYGAITAKEKKINKDLVPWDKLEADEQKKDYEQIRAIPKVLFGIGRGVYR